MMPICPNKNKRLDYYNDLYIRGLCGAIEKEVCQMNFEAVLPILLGLAIVDSILQGLILSN
jgi:hypothetical protein